MLIQRGSYKFFVIVKQVADRLNSLAQWQYHSHLGVNNIVMSSWDTHINYVDASADGDHLCFYVPTTPTK